MAWTTASRRRMMGALVIAAGVIAGAGPLTSSQGPARRIAMAAASDLQTLLPEVVDRFTRDTGAAVALSFGSSGNFFAQIQNGAPFDVFLSADIDYPARLVTSKHAEANSLYEYATGRIVLWTRTDSGIDVRRGLEILRDARVKRIAIANPELAPYGRAAVAALRGAKLYDAVQSRLVIGDNISQAAQFAESGNAEAGIIAMSLALGPALLKSGTYFEIPATAHPPIRQAGVVVSASKNKETARLFLAYLKRPEIIELLTHKGFTPPPASRPR